MSFADNREGWTNIAGVVASLVAAYFTFGASTAAEAAAGAAAAEAGVGGGAAAGEAAYVAPIAATGAGGAKKTSRAIAGNARYFLVQSFNTSAAFWRAQACYYW